MLLLTSPALLAQRAHKALSVQRVRPALIRPFRVPPVRQAQQAPKEMTGMLVLMERQDQRDRRGPRAMTAISVRMVQPVLLDHRERPDQPALKDRPVRRVLRVCKEEMAQLVPRVRLAP